VRADYDKVTAGERVRAFLEDEYVKAAFEAVEREAMRRFKHAKTDEELRRAHALTVVTDSFAGLLVQVVEEGQLARNAE
jgi:hypothetical protein